jgi:ribosomal protein S18 acetylase RimI-like enzyme
MLAFQARESRMHRMITVRKAISDDFAAWWEVRKRALGQHPDAFGSTLEDALATSDEDARDRFVNVSIAGDNALFVALDDAGTMVGVTGIYRQSGRKETHRAGIWGVYVDPATRGQGVGGKLLDAAIDYARSIPGLLQLELTVACHNAPAYALYERSGFQVFGRHPRGLMLEGSPIDEFLMVLLLDAPVADAGFDLTER